MFIDTHCHLDISHFDVDREEVIQRAFENGIDAVITIGTDVESSEKAIQLADRFPRIFAAAGIHPNDAVGYKEKETLKIIEDMTSHPKVVAIGEIGMDFYWNKSPVEIQGRVFREQIQLAKSLNMPIVIHNREASDEILQILRNENTDDLKGVAHCFSSDVQTADAFLSLGLHISFTGNITFKKVEMDEVVRYVPSDRLLLETDAPFLTPVPYRGKRNEPLYVTHTAEYIARTRELPLDGLSEMTSKNAIELFSLKLDN